ncbi:hypothetical protein CGRA01v4_08992 [Colletotrichum graminicola]|nr:hypothetical protein CGRA01v4_08992 [Colletotrichum graminicola]
MKSTPVPWIFIFIAAAPSPLSPPLVRFSFHACCLARAEPMGMQRKQRHGGVWAGISSHPRLKSELLATLPAKVAWLDGLEAALREGRGRRGGGNVSVLHSMTEHAVFFRQVTEFEWNASIKPGWVGRSSDARHPCIRWATQQSKRGCKMLIGHPHDKKDGTPKVLSHTTSTPRLLTSVFLYTNTATRRSKDIGKIYLIVGRTYWH